MNIPYIPGQNKYTFFINGTTKEIKESHPFFADVVKAINEDDEELLSKLLEDSKKAATPEPVSKLKRIIEETIDNLTLRMDEATGCFTVIYNNQIELPACLSSLLIRLWRDGCKKFSHYSKFIENLMANPSISSRESLFDFLAIQQLPITEDGTFVAYKGIQSNMYSCTGNKSTRVVSGVVDSSGRILNTPGSHIRVLVEDVDPDRAVGCSTGLHVGSYNYASGFGSVTVAVEVNPAHVISVPNDCGFQKCRVSEYTVLNVIDREFSRAEVKISEDKTETHEVTQMKNRASETGCKIEDVDKTRGRSAEGDRARVLNYLNSDKALVVVYGRQYPNSATVRSINKALFKNFTAEETANYVARIGFFVHTCGSSHTGTWIVSAKRHTELV